MRAIFVVPKLQYVRAECLEHLDLLAKLIQCTLAYRAGLAGAVAVALEPGLCVGFWLSGRLSHRLSNSLSRALANGARLTWAVAVAVESICR